MNKSSINHTKNHRCNKCFLLFYSGHVFYFLTFLNIFSAFFFILKTLSKAKYEYAKIQRETLLEDASAMIFIDFGLLRSHYCKISYLLQFFGGN